MCGECVELTAKEFDLLAFLAHSPRQVFNRGQLLEHVWASRSDWQDEATVTDTSGGCATRSKRTPSILAGDHRPGHRLPPGAIGRSSTPSKLWPNPGTPGHCFGLYQRHRC